MTPRLFVLAGLAALALTACSRTEPTTTPTAEPPAEAIAEAPPAEPAPMIAADAPKPAGTFSAAALAGRYEGDGELLLNADGTFNHTLGGAIEEGTWGAEPDDPTRVRLDPNSKAAQDQVLQIVSNDELKPVVGANAKSPASEQSFKRIATP